MRVKQTRSLVYVAEIMVLLISVVIVVWFTAYTNLSLKNEVKELELQVAEVAKLENKLLEIEAQVKEPIIIETIKEVVKIQTLTFVQTIDETDFNDVLSDFETMMNIYKDYLNRPEIHDTISYDTYVKMTNEALYYRVLNKWGYENK